MIDYDKLNLDTLARSFSKEEDAIAFVESLLWPKGPVCPHCTTVNNAWKLTSHSQGQGKRTIRKGLWKCGACKRQFTVRMGTIFEESKIPLRKWLQIIHLLCCSKKGVSSHQIARQVGVTQRTAWFAAMRIREAMKQLPLALKGTVEVDETYLGGKPRKGDNKEHKRGRGTKKTPVMVLVERDGSAHSVPLENVTSESLVGEAKKCVSPTATIMTDEFQAYEPMVEIFARHETVKHSEGEFSRLLADGLKAHTNTAESFFALLKRGHYGIFHQLSKEHLHRYCTEFGFRWDRRKVTDGERMVAAIKGAEGKRLLFKKPVADAG